MNRTLACCCAALVLSLWGAGCGDDTSGPGGGGGGGGGPSADPLESRYTSGSRLKIQVQRAGDAEIFSGVIDSELDTPCFVQPAGDDTLRCVPLTNASVVYRDAACTDPVATYYPSLCNDTGPGVYAALYEQISSCAGYRTRTFQVGAEISPPPGTLYQLNGDNCSDTGSSGPAFELGAELEDDAMVAIETVEAARGDALTVQYFHSEDGFYLIGNVITDTAHDVACYPQAIGSGLACAPSGGYVSPDYFIDASCENKGVVNGSADCEQPLYAVGSVSTGTCMSESHVYEVGAPLDAVYEDDGVGGCTELPGAFTYPLAVGAQLPDEELPPVDLAIEGEGDVRVQGYQAAGLPIIAYANFVTSDDQLCFGYQIDGDTLRCAPPTIAYVSVDPNRYYSDAACSDIVVQIYAGECIAQDATAVIVSSGVQGECIGTEGIYEFGASYTGTVYTHNPDIDVCAEYPPSDQYIYKQLGARIPNESFAEITYETL